MHAIFDEKIRPGRSEMIEGNNSKWRGIREHGTWRNEDVFASGCKIIDEQSQDGGRRWESSRTGVNGWHEMERLYRSETRAASPTASSIE